MASRNPSCEYLMCLRLGDIRNIETEPFLSRRDLCLVVVCECRCEKCLTSVYYSVALSGINTIAPIPISPTLAEYYLPASLTHISNLATTAMESLPVELLISVFRHLEIHEALDARLVCRKDSSPRTVN